MRTSTWILIGGLFLITCSVLFNTKPLLFDEVLFPPNVILMEKYGFGKQFLLEMVDQAPGPLYQFIHYPLRSITNLEARNLRIVNLIFFFAIIIGLYFIYNRTHKLEPKKSLYLSIHLIAISTIWQVAGLALTEIPAMFFATIGFYFGTRILISEKPIDTKTVLSNSILMGLFVALAVLGRTPYLIMLPSFIIVVAWRSFQNSQWQKGIVAVLPFTLIVLAMTLPIFITWNGLVPPLQPRVDGAIVPWHGILAAAYAGVITLILDPKWFIINKTMVVMLCASFVIFILLNLIGLGFEYAPMSHTVAKIIGLKYILVYVVLISPLLATFGILFLLSCLYHGIKNIHNPAYLFTLLVTVLLLLSSAKISHQFSSRYVAQAAPFMILLLANSDSSDRWKWMRIIIAIIMGLFSLNTYAKLF